MSARVGDPGSALSLTRADTQADWIADLSAARKAGYDALMLNTGDAAWVDTQLGFAYAAAQQVGIKLALSFDFVRGRVERPS